MHGVNAEIDLIGVHAVHVELDSATRMHSEEPNTTKKCILDSDVSVRIQQLCAECSCDTSNITTERL